MMFEYLTERLKTIPYGFPFGFGLLGKIVRVFFHNDVLESKVGRDRIEDDRKRKKHASPRGSFDI